MSLLRLSSSRNLPMPMPPTVEKDHKKRKILTVDSRSIFYFSFLALAAGQTTAT